MNEREKIIEPKDKIIIGFSGGKDSLLLTNLLGQLMKDKRYQIEVLAIHVTNKQVGYELDLEHAKELYNILIEEHQDSTRSQEAKTYLGYIGE